MQTLQIKKHQHIIMCVMNGTKLSAISLNFVATHIEYIQLCEAQKESVF